MRTPDASTNIVLIGMPGAGKSTIGVLLAKVLARGFLDSDLLIQAKAGCRLHEIIASAGAPAFRQLEEASVLEIEVRQQVIATGGSVVYSDAAMQHLRRHGFLIWLRLPVELLRQRLDNLVTRGVVMAAGQSLDELAAERHPLYERYADLTIDCGTDQHERLIARLIASLPPRLHDAS